MPIRFLINIPKLRKELLEEDGVECRLSLEGKHGKAYSFLAVPTERRTIEELHDAITSYLGDLSEKNHVKTELVKGTQPKIRVSLTKEYLRHINHEKSR